MICYLDTSALVKLYVQEPGSEIVYELTRDSDVVATCKIAYAEARAAFARGHREGILDNKNYDLITSAFQQDWESYFSLEVSDILIRLAGDLAEKHALRGFDAMHLAAAVILKQQVSQPVTMGCWDVRLWKAAQNCDLQVVPSIKPGG
ncbi:MAG: type II toxin-antitoxin system VapC family toxin [Desulfotomaculum sp.]|nr:type II toxin-antitoxin system VapC family toxin [Desulfotomaculum sp.]